MKKAIFILTFCFSTLLIKAQTNIDSLINVLRTENLTPAKKIDLITTISDAYLDSDIESAIQYIRIGIGIVEKENDLLNESRFYQSLSMAYQEKTNFDTAHIYMEKALKLASDSNDKKRLTNALFGLATLFMDERKYESSINSYIKSLQIADEIDYQDLNSSIFLNLGIIHHLMKNEERSIYYYNKAKYIAEIENNSYIKMNVYQAIGNYYNSTNEFEKALSYTQQAYLSAPVSDKRSQALLLCSIALLNEKFKEYDKGLENAYEALKIAQEFNLSPQIIASYNVLSNIYREKQMFNESKEMALKGWELDSTNLHESVNLAFNIAIANINLGNKTETVDFFWKYDSLKNQLTEKESYEALIEMEIKYETDKKEMLIASLEKEKLLYLWLCVTGVVLFLISISALYYRHRLNIQKRKVAEHQKELAEKQTILSEQQREIAEQQIIQLEHEKQLIAIQAALKAEKEERSRLAKDLHNRLGGLLTVAKLNLKKTGSYLAPEIHDISCYNITLDILNQSHSELRRIARNLMPISLRDGLKISIGDFCRTINIANFNYYGSDKRLEEHLELLLYHSAYELINNAVKYSDATAINVQLIIDDDGLVSLSVQDDGKGFNTNEATSGTGLHNIQAHVSAYNGKMTIYSSPGNGTEINIEFENVKNV
jgi:Signal transduction histidine kinase